MSWDQRIPSDKLLHRQLDLSLHDLHLSDNFKSSRPRSQQEVHDIKRKRVTRPTDKAPLSVQAGVAKALALVDLQRPVYNPNDCTSQRNYDRNNDLSFTRQMVEHQLFRNGAFTGQFWNQSTRQDREKT